MKCPFCGKELRVIDSRPSGGTVRRRRDCDDCHYRTTTYEISYEQLEAYKKLEKNNGEIMDAINGLVAKYS